jgi:glycosyltransferase involved in cell wall biosynthesis
MTRLLLLAEHYPPTMGGVATSAQRISQAIRAQGVAIDAFTFDYTRPLDVEDYSVEEYDDGLRVRRVGPFFLKNSDPRAAQLSEKHRAILRRRAFNTLLKIATEGRYDAVLSLYLLNAGFIAGLLANALGVPHLAGVRGNDIGRNIFDVQRLGVVQWVLEHAARIVCVNGHLRDRTLIAFPQHRHKTTVISNSVRSAAVSDAGCARAALMARTGWSRDDTVFVFIGTPREKKGIVPLLRAFAMLSEHAPARLLIVGPSLSGTEVHLVKEEWDALQASGRLHVSGLLSRQDVPAAATAGDVIVMPSLDDGMANGLLEGMSLGLCPLVSRIFADVLEGADCGVMIDDVSESALVEAIMAMSTDRSALRAQGQRAREHVLANYLPSHEGQRYADLCAAVVGRR